MPCPKGENSDPKVDLCLIIERSHLSSTLWMVIMLCWHSHSQVLKKNPHIANFNGPTCYYKKICLEIPLLFSTSLPIFMEGHLLFICTSSLLLSLSSSSLHLPCQHQLLPPTPLESLLPAASGLRGPYLKSSQFPCGRCRSTAAASAAASVVWNSNPWWVFRAHRWIN